MSRRKRTLRALRKQRDSLVMDLRLQMLGEHLRAASIAKALVKTYGPTQEEMADPVWRKWSALR